MTIKSSLAAVLLAAMSLAGASAAPAMADESLRIAIPVPVLSYYSVFVARDKGFFKDQGIDMEIVVTQGDGPDVDALIAGSVQFAATTPNRLLTAYQEGKPLLGALSIFNRIGINCFINKDKAEAAGIAEDTPIDEKFAKLKGMTIGATRPGAFTYLVAVDYLKRAGLEPQVDAQVIGAGAGPAMMAALENGQIDVGCIASPTPELAVSRGKSIMFTNNTQGWDAKYDEFLFSMLYVRPDFAKEKPEMVRKVVAALKEAMEFIVEAPFEEQEQILRDSFGDVDEAILRESLANTQAAIEPSGIISEKSYEAAVNFLIDTDAISAAVPYEAVIDNSFQAE